MVLGIKTRQEPEKAVPGNQDLRRINGVPHDPNWAAFYASLPPPTPDRVEDLCLEAIPDELRRELGKKYREDQEKAKAARSRSSSR